MSEKDDFLDADCWLPVSGCSPFSSHDLHLQLTASEHGQCREHGHVLSDLRDDKRAKLNIREATNAFNNIGHAGV